MTLWLEVKLCTYVVVVVIDDAVVVVIVIVVVILLIYLNTQILNLDTLLQALILSNQLASYVNNL